MADARLLVDYLREPGRLANASGGDWEAMLRIARAESLIGQLSAVTREADLRERLPDRVRAILDDIDIGVAASQRNSRWEAHLCARALKPLGVTAVLLKGAAYLQAGLPSSTGRTIGDLDILVPRAALTAVEEALVGAGWEWLKPVGDYDDRYYRTWMHELPPLVARDRGEMIDVHHTILPLTARRRPNAAAMLADAVPVGEGLAVLAPSDMVLHSVAHMLADGELQGGLRNLWDIHRLLAHFDSPAFRAALSARAKLHQLERPLAIAQSFAAEFFGAPYPRVGGPLVALLRRRLLGRDRWGRDCSPLTTRFFYIRGHLLRMPPNLLARHLLTKWRMRRAGEA